MELQSLKREKGIENKIHSKLIKTSGMFWFICVFFNKNRKMAQHVLKLTGQLKLGNIVTPNLIYSTLIYIFTSMLFKLIW